MNVFQEIKTLKDVGVIHKDAPHSKSVQFLEICKDLGLNPYRSELFLSKKYNPELGSIFVTFIGINGMNKLAHTSGEYTGCDEPKYYGSTCTVSVYRNGNKFSATVDMEEYKNDSPTWIKFPQVMIAKVAKSHALRAAFPEKLNGIYVEEEFGSYLDVFVSNNVQKKIDNQIGDILKKINK